MCGLEQLGFDSRHGQVIFLFSAASRPTPGAHPALYLKITEALSPGVRRLGREADHLFPTNAEIKYGGVILPLPNTSSLHGA
jgi:hypothetical protein